MTKDDSIPFKKYYVGLILFLTSFYINGQNKGSFIISGQVSQFNYNKSGQFYYYGAKFEWFASERISLRGGLFGSPNLIRISTAPLMWLLYSSDTAKQKQNFNHGEGLVFLALFALCDGMTYNMKIVKGLYFTPYIAPWQADIIFIDGKSSSQKVYNFCAFGAGIKFIPQKHFAADIGIEYNLPYKPIQIYGGYTLSATLGYIITSKEKTISTTNTP